MTKQKHTITELDNTFILGHASYDFSMLENGFIIPGILIRVISDILLHLLYF